MYLQKILEDEVELPSGVVKLSIPYADGSGKRHLIKGLVDGDTAFKAGVTWGSIVPQMESISELTQIINNQNVFSWVSSSTGAWKGTDPFTFDLTFYLITYKYGQKPSIKQQAAWIAQLCALYTKDKFATATVHGGYKLDLADSNKSGRNYFFEKNLKGKASNIYQLLKQDDLGLVSLSIGTSLTINKLLVQNVTITPSSAQVEKGIPLYIKMDVSFRTHRALLTGDVNTFFDLPQNADEE